jgi:hypothetical protein
MTFAMPDKGADPANPEPKILLETGCQFVSMRYQLIDTNSQAMISFFNKNRSAFVLKPERLRYVPTQVDDPPAQNPNLSYASRTISSNYYNFNV